MNLGPRIAHPGKEGEPDQTVRDHLVGVSKLTAKAAAKIGLEPVGQLLGLLHDFGKYSDAFQAYIKSATGKINPDEDQFVDAGALKGKIDHSTAGAQLCWNALSLKGERHAVIGQIIALCVASHHSGLIDCIDPAASESTQPNFLRRMDKSVEKTFLKEVELTADVDILDEVNQLFAEEGWQTEFFRKISIIFRERSSRKVKDFKLGLLVRYLFSCLIDGDRTDTADFEKPHKAKSRQHGKYVSWDLLIERLEMKLASFDSISDVARARQAVSDACFSRAGDPTGIYTLTVPTGGGKTLASLRFALHHAKKHQLDRVIVVLPYTSIIEQNAAVVKGIFEQSVQEEGKIVLEHHSNVLPERQNWKTKSLAENWDAPIIFTTSVQLLETLFSGGTSSVRKMHQLAKSVVIFDEVQTLPLRCFHMFCNAANFITEHLSSSIVLCTATQPLLGELESEENGRLFLPPDREIIPDVNTLFQSLKRVQVVDRRRKDGGWTVQDVADFAVEEANNAGSCLVIVNTKKSAAEVYNAIKAGGHVEVLHLSTSMCPAHRLAVLDTVRDALGKRTIVCVSTQLIEAGVDIDFGSVIRYLAGLDSIAQAAGRCNRHGLREIGYTHIVNPAEEKITSLIDIRIGKEKAQTVLDNFNDNPVTLGGDLLSPETIRSYFSYYLYSRSDEMSYPIGREVFDREDTILNLLSDNPLTLGTIGFHGGLRQSFKSAGDAFAAIDAPTRGIFVPYGDTGRDLIARMCGAFDIKVEYELLRKAQRYTVSVFPNVLEKLQRAQALYEVQDTGMYYLDDRFYSSEFGVADSPVSEALVQIL